MATTDIAKGDEGGMGYLQSVPRRVVTVYLPLLIFVIVLLFPFYWMAITAVKPNEQMTNFNDYSPFWVVSPTLEHIKYLLFQTSYPGWLLNTVIISTAATFLSLLASVFAAYAIERLRFSGSRHTPFTGRRHPKPPAPRSIATSGRTDCARAERAARRGPTSSRRDRCRQNGLGATQRRRP